MLKSRKKRAKIPGINSRHAAQHLHPAKGETTLAPIPGRPNRKAVADFNKARRRRQIVRKFYDDLGKARWRVVREHSNGLTTDRTLSKRSLKMISDKEAERQIDHWYRAGFRSGVWTVVWIELLAAGVFIVAFCCSRVQAQTFHNGSPQNLADFPPFQNHPVERKFVTGIPLTELEQLGKDIIFDYTLSSTRTYSCLMCHRPRTGWSSPSSDVNEFLGPVPGAVAGRFGKRKPPSIAYNIFSPPGPFVATINGETKVIGGLFWDGREGDPHSQPRLPFLDQNEMNEPSDNGILPPVDGGFSSDVVRKVLHREDRFKEVFGHILSTGPSNQQVYQLICDAIAAYELSREVNPFSSKYDVFVAGKAMLSASEENGRELFFGKAQCSECHSSVPLKFNKGSPAGDHELFTMFCYANTGVPKNLGNPAYQTISPQFIDVGLAGNPNRGLVIQPDGTLKPTGPKFYGQAEYRGLFKAPTLRNVDKRPSATFVRAYFHNGVMKSLAAVVHFYNKRNVAVRPDGSEVVFDLRDGPPKGARRLFPAPEVLQNVVNVAGKSPEEAGDTDEDNGEVGNLRLTHQDEDDLVAFLKTLTDVFPEGSP